MNENERAQSASFLKCNFNPIHTEGGGILPASTLDVNNFFNNRASANKLGDFI